jgi:hypothetical protein
VITDDHICHFTLAVDQQADLTPDFMGKVAQIAGELGANQELGLNAAAVKVLKSSDLIGFKTGRISKKFFHRIIQAR